MISFPFRELVEDFEQRPGPARSLRLGLEVYNTHGAAIARQKYPPECLRTTLKRPSEQGANFGGLAAMGLTPRGLLPQRLNSCRSGTAVQPPVRGRCHRQTARR